MSIILKNKSSCLFQNRKSKFNQIFKLNKNRCSDYQIIGDNKLEEEIEIDFINEISAKHNEIVIQENNKTQNQLINTIPLSISNNLNKSQHIRKLSNTSKIQIKKQSISKLSNRMSIKKSSILSNGLINKNSITILDNNKMPPTLDLLLDLYNKGMYDKTNPSHQHGLVKLTEKQKSKWKLPDYHPLVYAANIKDFHPFSFFYGTKYKDLVKENGETKYPEGKLVNYNEWQVEPDYSLNGI